MTPEEFHIARTMFATIGDTLLIAPKKYGYSHNEWLSQLFGIEKAAAIIEENTRGYYLGNRLVGYQGQSFDKPKDLRQLKLAFYTFDRMFPYIKSIGIGVIPGRESPWEVKTVLSRTDFIEQINN